MIPALFLLAFGFATVGILAAENLGTTTLGQIALAVLAIVGFLVQQWVLSRNQARQRKWDAEDRRRIADEQAVAHKRIADELAAKTAAAAATIKQDLHDTRHSLRNEVNAARLTQQADAAEIKDRIAQNRDLTAKGFRETNDFTQRLNRQLDVYDKLLRHAAVSDQEAVDAAQEARAALDPTLPAPGD